MAKLRIFFFLLGDSSPSNDTFPIVASPNTSVGEVKDMVHAKKPNRLRGIDPSDLRLWKVLSALFLPFYNVLKISNY